MRDPQADVATTGPEALTPSLDGDRPAGVGQGYRLLAAQVRASQTSLGMLLGLPIESLIESPIDSHLDPTAATSPIDRVQLIALQADLANLQPPHPVVSDTANLARLGAIDLEICKQLRLIQIDRQFLQTARQRSTQLQRLEAIRGHLSLLDRYCQGALEQLES